MNESDGPLNQLVSLRLLQFIDRIVEAERRATSAGFERCDVAMKAYARSEDLRHEAGDAKIQKANEVLDYRLEEMNNFRSQINHERTEYLRREMYDRDHNALADRVKSLEIARGEQAGRTAAYASVVGFVVVLVQIVLHFLR
jgi:hypothetical protein